MTRERLQRLVDSVDTKDYEIRTGELLILLDERDRGRALIMAYKYGFLRGQRAERVRRKKSIDPEDIPLDITITEKGREALEEDGQ